MRVDLPWANTVYDVSGIEQVVSFNDLKFGEKVCSKCYSNIKPVLSCKKCGINSCDACAKWVMSKSTRLVAAHCGECGHRLGVLI
jgi:hypothetical protein